MYNIQNIQSLLPTCKGNQLNLQFSCGFFGTQMKTVSFVTLLNQSFPPPPNLNTFIFVLLAEVSVRWFQFTSCLVFVPLANLCLYPILCYDVACVCLSKSIGVTSRQNKKVEEEEKLLKLFQGVNKAQDGFTQWCEQMLHALNTANNLDGKQQKRSAHCVSQ